jgi:catechol 2,3-dioxygenase-like lactoylglutathione lyase family enzyme
MITVLNANVTLMITDMNASVKFYIETLGLQLTRRYGDHWAEISAAGIVIALHPTSKQLQNSDKVSIGLRVENLENAVAALAEKGVQCKVQNDAKVKLAHFTDPDGNNLYLSQAT